MNGMKLKCVANVLSGVYLRPSPTGTIAYLQVRDLQMQIPEKTTDKVDFVPKLRTYLLQKGDLLFAGKGNNYLCKIFDLDIHAVPSTTLFIIRPTSDLISSEYLNVLLNIPQIAAKIKSFQVGSGMPLIHKSTLEELEIAIPDKKTQSLIVEIAHLQQREQQILDVIAEKRTQITDQILLKCLMINENDSH